MLWGKTEPRDIRVRDSEHISDTGEILMVIRLHAWQSLWSSVAAVVTHIEDRETASLDCGNRSRSASAWYHAVGQWWPSLLTSCDPLRYPKVSGT